MSQEKYAKLLQFFRVIGNESRLKILGMLANEEHSAGELAGLLDLKEPTVSRHLSAMNDLDLVSVRVEGNARVYALNTKFLEGLNRELFSGEKQATLVDDTSGDAWERKVLQAFLAGERIKELPSQHKKKLVVLNWLAQKFELGARYTEKEMNERLKRHNPDYAALRRYLVDFGYMQREKGQYWRVEPGAEDERKTT